MFKIYKCFIANQNLIIIIIANGGKMKSLAIIGPGKVGKTLGKLFAESKVFNICKIHSRSEKKINDAIEFIGSGSFAETVNDAAECSIIMITTPDSIISSAAKQLYDVVKPGTIIFHCSGCLSSTVLKNLRKKNCFTASIHPVQSFADPKITSENFNRTWCGCEGDKEALDILKPAFEAIGGKTFDINTENKALYHASAVIACNLFTALEEIAVLSYEKSGVPRETAMQILEPIVKNTAENIFKLGTANALTGPVARGDSVTIQKHIEQLSGFKQAEEIYRLLSITACDLSEKQGSASKNSLKVIEDILKKN